MAESTVQVPMSLARAIVGQLRNDAEQIDGEWGWSRDVAKIRASSDPDDYGKEQVRLSDALDALLSQPTPTGEPPRIEDLATGTTFTARTYGDDPDEYPVRFRKGDAGLLLVQDWRRSPIFADELDPSTIRDVTPPGAAQ